ncbi:Family of uncharacterised function (DUF490) [Phocoenobacter uteri]|uniref:Family of uncharacterized function (DUF490) n=1 Tax=Phocoenobacter uteri TaxID=146806 RepID=A0A379C8R1_9PAST|nr:translocation/assembly module TamB domain-containing protein [Phocoenobacter uteri]MDG6882360.1 hypothetical protein [Phocoenobacter uteri]SUB58518.1 Family of uncharacterised function (DUF490) [Phocoenobacter uteri]
MNDITELPQTEETERPIKTKSRWRWLGYFFLVLVSIFIIVMGLLTTSFGQRQAILLANRLVDQLSISEVSGNLQDGLILKNSQFKMDGVNVKLKEANLKLDFNCVLDSKVCVDRIQLQDPTILIDTAKLPKSKADHTNKVIKFNLPIPISAQQLSVHNLHLKIDETELDVQSFTSGIQGKGKDLTLQPTNIQNISLLLPPQAVKSEQKFAKNEKNMTASNKKKFDIAALKDRLAQPLLTLPNEIAIPLNLAILQFNVKNIEIKQAIKDHAPKSLINIHSVAIKKSQLKDQQLDLTTFSVTSDKGNIDAQGKIILKESYPLDWKINADTPLFEELKLPASQAEITLSGALKEKTVLKLTTQGALTSKLKGHIQLSKPKAPFKLHLTSPKILYPFIKDKQKSEQFNAQNIMFNLDGNLLNYNIDLVAKLLDQPLSLTGKLASTDKAWIDVQNTLFLYGKNEIKMHGLIGENSDFHTNISAPDLTGLVPHLNATLNGTLNLKGNVTQPNIDLDLIAKNVNYKNLTLRYLTTKGHISSDEQIKGHLKAKLDKFNYNDIKINDADLNITGTEKEHHLTLISNGSPVAGNLQISGKFDRLLQQWRGTIQNVNVQSPVGVFKNQQDVKITYLHKLNQAEISAHCWQNKNIDLCFPHQFSVGKAGSVPFNITKLNLDIIKPYLDKKTQLNGIIEVVGNAQWFKNKPPQIEVEAKSELIGINHKIDYRHFPITVMPLKLSAKLLDNNLKVNTVAQIKNNGILTSELTIQDITGQRYLDGFLNIDDIDIKLLKPLLSKSEHVKGKINANLTFAGTTTSPLLNGELNLSQLNVRAYTLPFDVTEGYLKMLFKGTHSTLDGGIKSPNGQLSLTGDADWTDLANWKTRVHASTESENFRLNIPNMAKLDVVTEIEVSATPQKLTLNGDIFIPWARVEIEALPENTISVSSDEVIMDGSMRNKNELLKKLPQKDNSMAIEANVNIRLAEDEVKLNAYGLKTDLNGTIKVSQGEKGLGLYGQIFLDKGTYNSFGQNLVIRKGSIIFAGIPSQPSLNIEAIRNPEAIEDNNVTAGVKITGVADAPQVTVFSEPAMSKANALSYILTGRGLENSSEAGSQNSIAAAAIGLGLSQSSKLVGNIGNTFGIHDLHVTTAGIGDNTKVVVSGSLTPKFKVKYGTGIFAALSELTLRYRLAPQLYLQWVSSVNQTVDLMYKFEFD